MHYLLLYTRVTLFYTCNSYSGLRQKWARNAKTIQFIFSKMQVRWHHLVIPVVLSLFIASMSGVSLGLLVPLAKGIANNDFSFVDTIPFVGKLLRSLFDALHLQDPGNRSFFLLLTGCIVAAHIVKNGFVLLLSIYTSYWNGRFIQNINISVFKRFLRFGKQYFDSVSQGNIELIFRYNDEMLRLFIVLHEVTTAFFKVIIHSGIMLYVSWQLTAVTACAFPILFLCMRRLTTNIKRFARQKNRLNLATTRERFNMLQSIPLIKCYSQEEQIHTRHAWLQDEIRQRNFVMASMQSAVSPLTDTIITFALLCTLAAIVFVLKTDIADISTYIAFLFIAQRTIPEFSVFARARTIVAELSSSVQEVMNVYSDTNKCIIPDGTTKFSGLQQNIHIKNLDFAYSADTPVLRDISLDIPCGTTTAIVGPTGSGKSTLIQLLMRLYDVPAGSILFDNIDTHSFTFNSLRKHIAYVSQEAFLFNDSLRTNLVFGLDRTIEDEELKAVLKKAQLHGFLAKLPEGLDTVIGDRGIKLSGGEKQRLSIARALLKNADILLLDEATSALDSTTEKHVQKAIDTALKQRTAIVIAHRLSTIQHADCIVYLEQGSIVEQGTLAELLEKKGKFHEQWEHQRFF